eukprot:scaffold658492_cov149-Prasinocladus_malaysianus.AAC.1
MRRLLGRVGSCTVWPCTKRILGRGLRLGAAGGLGAMAGRKADAFSKPSESGLAAAALSDTVRHSSNA